VVTIGGGVVLHSLYSLATTDVPLEWFVLAGLTLLSGSFTVRIPTIPARLSVSETFVFAATLLFGPPAATVIVVLDTLIISLWLRRPSRRPSRVLFNVSAPAIAIWTASHVFFMATRIQPLSVESQPIWDIALPLLLLALVYFALNSSLIAIAVGLEQHVSPTVVWRHNFLWLSLNYFSGASLAALLLPYFRDENGALWTPSILLPVLIISYLTFKTALGRFDDANRHLTELNKLYLSTIETLAMAIDAKDQITHGHIRRVQSQAVELAREMGVSDKQLIQAIEAAALLHDMGKLAVPEHILNKPGPLTPSEFDRMKLHAAAGADILSAIDFPYPVVPIVRHHHENWDGTGYPDGLTGADIPIGARILSVVDCFDALTSDRPYRPRLSGEAALKILTTRRGTMYDPLVVDTFVRLHLHASGDSLARHHSIAHPQPAQPATGMPLSSPGLVNGISGRPDAPATIGAAVDNLSSSSDINQISDVVLTHVRKLISCSLAVVFVRRKERDELLATACSGNGSELMAGVAIPVGKRLSGWVAANKTTIRNSDPILDLGESLGSISPRLRSSLSVPILLADRLVGVFSLYATDPDFFTEQHQRVLEMTARHIGPTLNQHYQHHIARHCPQQDAVTGLPYFLQSPLTTFDASLPFSLITLAVEAPDDSGQLAMHAYESFLHAVVRVSRRSLRANDTLFRHGHRHFVVLLSHTAADGCIEIGNRLRDAVLLEGHALQLAPQIDIAVSVASAPQDGSFPQDLLRAALTREGARERETGSASIH
jgi:putative nucleotidyltransferase with HDIG domain